MKLITQFDAIFSSLLQGVDEGRAAHDKKNIKDSGTPFEDKFRDFLSRQLPKSYSIKNGTFYTPATVNNEIYDYLNSDISNEIDIIIANEKESFNIQTHNNDKPSLPFTSILSIFQLKNSYSDLENAIEQSYNAMSKWNHMNNNMYQVITGSPISKPSRPISYIVCGKQPMDKNISDESIKKTLMKNSNKLPDYTILLETGILIIKTDIPELFTGLADNSMRMDHGLCNENQNIFLIRLCKGSIFGQNKEGVKHDSSPTLTLIWLYYLITSRLIELDESNSSQKIFNKFIEATYPMEIIETINIPTNL